MTFEYLFANMNFHTNGLLRAQKCVTPFVASAQSENVGQQYHISSFTGADTIKRNIFIHQFACKSKSLQKISKECSSRYRTRQGGKRSVIRFITESLILDCK